MPETKTSLISDSDFPIYKTFWSLYLLMGLESLAIAGFTILVVPLSLIIWPNEPYHALEIGILIAISLWLSSISGLLFGILVDRYSRKKIIFLNSIFRSFSMVMLGFAVKGKGFQTWIYFLFFMSFFAVFTGGSLPSIISISNDIVPKNYRSRFFSAFGITLGLFMTFGFFIASLFVQYGFWREYFWGLGISILITGLLFSIHIDEPKRGAQEEELVNILKNNDIEYNFQIDSETMKITMFSKTNIVALIEGIFSNIFIGSIIVLILPYIQTPPHNISPVATSVFLIAFGLTGALATQFVFGALSDKLCKDHPIRRIHFMIFSLGLGFITFILIFFIPLPHLTVAQGENIPYLFSLPIIWIMGILFLTSNMISAIFWVNQAPILQEINLPEAQGKITSWNQLVENIGWGLGALIVGILLDISNNNYQLTIILISIFIIPGIFVWFLAIKWYPDDSEYVREILEERAKILEEYRNIKNKKLN